MISAAFQPVGDRVRGVAISLRPRRARREAGTIQWSLSG